MIALPRGYDAWRTAGPDDFRSDVVGTEDGEPCNRYPEPDEDYPLPRSRPCSGLMMADDDGTVTCDRCGAAA